MKRKFNKKLLMFGLPILVLALVSAVVIPFLGQVQRNVIVMESFEFEESGAVNIETVGGEVSTSENMYVSSQTSVNIPLSIETTSYPDEEGITHSVNYLLDNSAGTCTPYPSETCEKRIFISAEDVEIETLNDFNSMSWDANVIGGYIAHVDVILETDALVFEYAKVDKTNCDNAPYPTGEVNTFNDKGIIDSDAYSWLSSGPAGPCGDSTFDNNHRSLTDWKTARGTEKVIGFEIEVDNWISNSDSIIWNIKINDEDVEVSILPLDSLNFNVDTTFGLLNEGTYTITTTVNVRE